MPAKNGVGLHQKDGVTPAARQPREQDNQAALVRPEGRTLDLAGGNDQLLSEKGVLGKQLLS
jgi:hypothetical protein